MARILILHQPADSSFASELAATLRERGHYLARREAPPWGDALLAWQVIVVILHSPAAVWDERLSSHKLWIAVSANTDVVQALDKIELAVRNVPTETAESSIYSPVTGTPARSTTILKAVAIVILLLVTMEFFVLRLGNRSNYRGHAELRHYPRSGTAVTALRTSLSSLSPSRVLWNPPLEMRQGDDYIMDARISLDPNSRDILLDLSGAGPVQLWHEDVSRIVRVSLTSLPADAFDIHAHVESEQLLTDRGYARWLWSVKPLHHGEFELLLQIANVITDGAGKDRVRVVPLKPRRVHVSVNTTYQITEFIKANMAIFLGSVAIPIIAGLWAWIRRRTTKAKRAAGF